MLSKVQLGPRYFTLTFQFEHIPFIQGLDECLLLYSQVTFLALVSTSFGGSKFGQWSGTANLTCTIEESVPSSAKSSAKLGLKDVLFLLIRLNTLSSPALQCGITRTSLATVESSGNVGSSVAREDMPTRWAQTTSILRTLVSGSMLCQLLATLTLECLLCLTTGNPGIPHGSCSEGLGHPCHQVFQTYQ